MSVWTDVRVINTGTGTGNLTAVTGLPGIPKALIAFGVNRGSAGQAVGMKYCYGAATAAAERWAASVWEEDADNPTDVAGVLYTDCLFALLASATTLDGKLDVASLDANGYTLTVDDAFAADTAVVIVAIGGSSITNAKAGTVTSGGAGSGSFTAPGFQPTALMFGKVGATAIDTIAANGQFSLGWVTGAVQRCLTAFSRDAQSSTTDTRSGLRNDCILAKCTSNADTYSNVWGFTSFDANGWTWNHSTGTDVDVVGYLALAGASVAILDVAQRTDTADQSVTGAGFQPTGMMLFARPGQTSYTTTPTASVEIMIGAASSVSARAAIWTTRKDADAQNPSDSELSTTRIAIDRVIETLTDEGEIDFKSFDSDGFTLDQITAGVAANQMFGVLFGPAATSGFLYTQLERRMPRGPNRGM